jgi:hypothetical protein
MLRQKEAKAFFQDPQGGEPQPGLQGLPLGLYQVLQEA